MDENKDTAQPELRILRDYILSARNFDALAFSTQNFEQAVKSRMSALSVSDASGYIDCLEVKPSEYRALFDILFRTAKQMSLSKPWSSLKEAVVPSLLSASGTIRIWDAGCGVGTESMLLCILFCEAIGIAAFQQRVKIFATDIDDERLSIARQANYSESELVGLPDDVQNRYFVKSSGRAAFRTDLRRSIIYGRHDIVTDPPISRMDLIVCRHVLPYFDRETQQRIVTRLRFACKESYYLLIGAGEVLPNDCGFLPSKQSPDLYYRNNIGEQAARAAQTPSADNTSLLVQESAFDNSPIAQLVIDASGALAMANARARTTFGLTGSDFGRPIQDLEISYRPVELRSLIDRMRAEDKPIVVKSVQRQGPNGKVQVFDVHVRALHDTASGLVGTNVQFSDVSEFFNVQHELISVNQQLQTANEELQSAHEELETTNEELHSTNEELETTNEELQSTNEELETINEELRSANNEMELTNTEQRRLTQEMEHANHFLEAILASIRAAVIVVTPAFQVIVWNKRATELFGLRSEEVIQHNFFSLDIGLPVEQLKLPLREFVQHKKRRAELTVSAVNRKGKQISCHIQLCPIEGMDSGVVIIIEEEAAHSGGK